MAEQEAYLTDAETEWFREECVVCLGGGCRKCEAVRDEVDRLFRERVAEALRKTADRWTQGEWSNVMLPNPMSPAVSVIAYANRVGDRLREQAEASSASCPSHIGSKVAQSPRPLCTSSRPSCRTRTAFGGPTTSVCILTAPKARSACLEGVLSTSSPTSSSESTSQSNRLER